MSAQVPRWTPPTSGAPYADKSPEERFALFDRFMVEAPADLLLSMEGDCYCGGRRGRHKDRCPLREEPTP
jgi:hypothetical protein